MRRSWLMAGLLALCATVGSAWAQSAPAAGAAPAAASARSAAVLTEPKADETNAQRAQTQPGNNAPMWRAVRQSGEVAGFTTLPGVEKGVLIQEFKQYPGSSMTTAGEAWRQVRNRYVLPYGGALIVIALLAVGIFYFTRGPLGGHTPYTGKKVERFTPFERAAHWTNALAWVVLAVSGVVMAFGKFLLLPILGGALFGYLTYALKTVHNLVGPLFAVSLVIVILTFVKDNFPRAGDLRWLMRLGGMLSRSPHDDVPSHRFNAGEKVLFWFGVFVSGLVVVGSGLVVNQLVPGIEATRANMQVALLVHGVSTAIMMALFVGHIYMGTLGTRDALQAMKTGMVDEGWAREHHALWAEDIRAGRIPAVRSDRGAGRDASAGAPTVHA